MSIIHVTCLAELYRLAQDDGRYRKVLQSTAIDLGAPPNQCPKDYLNTCAAETSEELVLEEVNHLMDLSIVK